MDTTGRRIKRLRLKKGISQSQLSKRSGITSTLLQQYEYGTRHPKEDQLNKIALALGVAPAMLRPLDVDTIEGLLAIIYDTLKNGWVFEDFTQFQRRENLVRAGQSS